MTPFLSPPPMHMPRHNATAYPTPHLAGSYSVPGDKSVSHRAIIFASLATGQTILRGLLPSTDVLATANALIALGARIRKVRQHWYITGCGVGGFAAPNSPLQLGNSGTGLRLLMGAASTSPIKTQWQGDASLRARPMARVLKPLAQMGVRTKARKDEFLPIQLEAPMRMLPLDYHVPVPSAQVKSALILAALGAAGRSTIIEPVLTRDHTERMLPAFGGKIKIRKWRNGQALSLDGEQELQATELDIAGDPSSAAFLMVAASLVARARIRLCNCMINPHRLGAVRALRQMGARITASKAKRCGGEQVADFTIRHAPLRAARFRATQIPAMVDEIPVLAVAAAFAKGRTQFDGLAELRVKESDRLSAIAQGLRANGVRCEVQKASLSVWGQDMVAGGGRVSTQKDHRIAMAFLVMGLASKAPVKVDNASMIATSFPDFFAAMRRLGARLDG